MRCILQKRRAFLLNIIFLLAKTIHFHHWDQTEREHYQFQNRPAPPVDVVRRNNVSRGQPPGHRAERGDQESVQCKAQYKASTLLSTLSARLLSNLPVINHIRSVRLSYVITLSPFTNHLTQQRKSDIVIPMFIKQPSIPIVHFIVHIIFNK